MDILQQELNNNKPENKSKKKVLNLLIICGVLLVIAIIGKTIIGAQPVKKDLSLEINGVDVSIDSDTFITVEEKRYIALEKICKLINYNYVRGGYLEYAENDNKCYLDSTDQIVGFEADSKKIYKTKANSQTDYINLSLQNSIVKNDSLLYIALEDLNMALNVVYDYDEDENKISLETGNYIIEQNEEAFTEKTYTISKNNFKNIQAISYGLFVVTGPNRKMGVVNYELQEVIGCKYSTIEFDEFAQNFIVSDEGKYGIVSKTGDQVVELNYDHIEIINYSPLLYKVKYNNNYGVIDKSGNAVVNIDYSDIGVNNASSGGRILIIEDAIENDDGIVVYKNGKYGLVNTKTQKEIVECILDKIFYNKDDKQYYIEINNQQAKLNEYISYIQTVIINLDR